MVYEYNFIMKSVNYCQLIGKFIYKSKLKIYY